MVAGFQEKDRRENGEYPKEEVIEKIISNNIGENFAETSPRAWKGEVLEAVVEIKDRHEAAKEIEKSLLGLYQAKVYQRSNKKVALHCKSYGRIKFPIQIVALLEYRTHCSIIQSLVVRYGNNHHKTEDNDMSQDIGRVFLWTGRTPKSIDAGEELTREKVLWPHDKKDSSKKSRDNSSKGSKSRDEISTKAKEEKDGK
ncbi:hypothetical protein C5167_028123 [Papaver somniferum]|nr:hypothetical protein C5167_028123 [Papaver somniferum]